jgi:phage/conjugal plasmid C-4 type zinc finger TraR family protein
MSDILDEAQEKTERERAAGIARVTGKLKGQSETHCVNCGEEIPFPRRAAVAGVKRCIDCQEDTERPR